jgi:predicted glycosyltransferase involved in capsule biosynthesis
LKNVPFAEVIIAAMEKDLPSNSYITSPRTRKYFTEDPFESSKANNIGASKAQTDIFVFQDADIIFNPDIYRKIVNVIKNKGFESVRVGSNCVNLGNEATSRAYNNDSELQKLLSQNPSGASRDAPGGCSAISREAFIRIGGHCELFKKYGWEDCYYRHKVGKLTMNTNLENGMFHLWHETNYQAGSQPVNAPLYSDLLSTDEGDSKELSERDRIDLLEKYPVFR